MPGPRAMIPRPRRRVVLVAAALAAVLAGCEQDAATLAQWVDNALDQGHFGEAEKYLARLRAKEPKGHRVHGAEAELRWRQRDFARGEAAFKAAIEASRGDAAQTLRYHFRLGRMLYDAGRFADAESELAGVARFEPKNVAARVWRGRAAEAATRYGDALKAYDAALRLDGNNLAARTGRVHCLIRTGDLKAAATDLEWLRERAPTDAWVRVLDGMVDETKGGKGALEDAEKSYRKAWELQKRTAFPHVALADFLLRHGRVDEAAGVLLGVPHAYAEAAGVLLRRGRLARLKGERAEALALLTKALAACPAQPVGPRWPDPARIDPSPAALRAAIEAELRAARGAAAPGATPATAPAQAPAPTPAGAPPGRRR